jgi:hypothetical protein
MTTEPTAAGVPGSIKLVSHSLLFYWWPVWACGLVLGVLSLLSGYRLAVLAEDSRLEAGTHVAQAFPVRVLASSNEGMVFLVVLLVVVFSTSIPLRGLWSLVVLLGLVLVAVLLAAFDLWGPILRGLGNLHVYISAAGYLVPSTVLLLGWLLTVFFYDQKRYIIFTPGQLVVHREVGDMQQVFDTTNVIVEKQRSDFFRHVLLGFMSGDVVVQVGGQPGRQFELPNVLFAAWKVKQVADLMRTRPVVPV